MDGIWLDLAFRFAFQLGVRFSWPWLRWFSNISRSAAPRGAQDLSRRGWSCVKDSRGAGDGLGGQWKALLWIFLLRLGFWPISSRELLFSWEAPGGNMLLILMVNRGYYITYMLYYTDPKAKLNTPLNLYRTTLAQRFAYSEIYSTLIGCDDRIEPIYFQHKNHYFLAE